MPVVHTSHDFDWGHDGLRLAFHVGEDGRVGLTSIGRPHVEAPESMPLDSPASLVEIRTVRDGSNMGHQNLHTLIGDRLVYRGKDDRVEGEHATLRLFLEDPLTGLTAILSLVSLVGSCSITAATTVTNRSDRNTTLLAVSAAVIELSASRPQLSDFRVWWAPNSWTAECRWTSDSLTHLVVPEPVVSTHSIDSRRPFGVSGLGTWSSGRFLPMGILENERTGFVVAWQVENPGPWRWEVGDRRESVVIGTFGPLDLEHHWSQTLGPGESFTTPDATFAFSDDGWNGAVAELSRTRQSRRAPHPSFQQKPVVYNDFFALFAEPTETNLRPLIDAAAEVGVDVFCIDAGWFDGEHGGVGGGAAGGHGWWDALGEFEESAWRFPNGMQATIDTIRDTGMIPGIWLEPEVIGVRSPLVDTLPAEAFFLRSGEPVAEHGRYQLDFSHPAARAHADALIDRVVGGYGFGYVKLDYNINPGAGTTATTESAGAGLLAHSRGMIEWLEGVSRRHPELIIMNCASGGMRMDGATQRFTHVQQMSDQAKPLPFSFISVAAPTMVPPDQAAAWLNPDSEMTTDEIEFAAIAPLLCRFELSGPIGDLAADRRQIVSDAITLYKSVRADVGISDPVWPWGLPRFDDEWLTLAQRNDQRTLLGVWRRSGADVSRVIELPWCTGATTVRILFPSDSGGLVSWSPETGSLVVELPRSPMAMLIEVTAGA